jgi:hypothetical protein
MEISVRGSGPRDGKSDSVRGAALRTVIRRIVDEALCASAEVALADRRKTRNAASEGPINTEADPCGSASLPAHQGVRGSFF